MAVKPDLSAAADVMKNLTAKKTDGGEAKPANKNAAKPAPASKVKVNPKAAGKSGGAAHMRSSNRGK